MGCSKYISAIFSHLMCNLQWLLPHSECWFEPKWIVRSILNVIGTFIICQSCVFLISLLCPVQQSLFPVFGHNLCNYKR